MQRSIKTVGAIPPLKNGRKCISAEEKFFRDIGFLAVQIFFLVKKNFVEICILLCVALVLCYWKRGRSKTKKVPKKTRIPPHSLFEMALESFDKGTADLCIDLLQEYDYDMNYQVTNNKLSLFLCACISGNARLMMFMIERGARANLCTAHGDSALYLATYGYLHSPKPDLHAISMLIAYGCDVNQSNFSGFTVLHQAAGKGNLFLTQYFIFKGADSNKRNKSGLLPYHIAFHQGHTEVAAFLKKRLKPKRVPNTV